MTPTFSVRTFIKSSPSKNFPEVSVVVCHHKGEFIFDFVDSALKSKDVRIEVIVVTSDPHLATQGIRGCRTVYETGGPAKKRNTGYRVAYGQYLAFFDDDVTIWPTCIRELLTCLRENTQCKMVYGKLFNMEHTKRFDEAGGYLTQTGFIWSRAEQNVEDVGQFNERVTILAGKSASCMIDADVFAEVGQFDEDFEILGEETDLSWRVWLAGWTVIFEPKAKGYHAFNTKFKPAKEYYTSKRVHFNGCRNYITMLIKNLEGSNLWRILPIHTAVWCFAGLAMIITLKIPQGVNIFRGLIYILWNLPKILDKRRRIQERRKISDRELMPLISRRPSWSYYKGRITRYIGIGLHG